MQCCSHIQGASPLMINTREEERVGLTTRLFRGASDLVTKLFVKMRCIWAKVVKLGREDPRRIYHSFKVGLALAIITLVYFIRSFYDRFGANAMWAVMTVVVIFEFSVGATLSKGLNRAFATLLAGALGVGVHYIASLSGEKGEPIILGAFVFLLVWAGVDLHSSTVGNLRKLADSLEGCVEEYFNERQEEDAKSKNTSILGYKTLLDSKSKEESLANFARWEPPHGLFGFRHPWKQYLKIGAMSRSCACCIEALNACITSEHKGQESIRQQLKDSCLKVSSMSSMILRELSTSIDTMTKPSTMDSLIDSINTSIEELYTNLKFMHFYHKSEEIVTSAALTDILPLATVASILIETVGRMEGIISAVDELSVLAGFKSHVQSGITGETMTVKWQHNSTINPICDDEGPHVIVAIRGPSLMPMNSIELQSKGGAHFGRWENQ